MGRLRDPRSWQWQDILDWETFPAVLSGTATVTACVFALFQDTVFWGWVAIASSLVGSIATTIQAIRNDVAKNPGNIALDIVGGLRMMHAVLIDDLELGQGLDPVDIDLRIVVYKSIGKYKDLVQATPYVGGEGNEPGRTIGHGKGIIGLCMEKKDVVWQPRRMDYPTYVDELMDWWKFNHKEAIEIAHDRNCWLAIPIFLRESIIGVVYLDSAMPDVFDEEFRELALSCAGGIGRIIEEG